MVYLLFYFSIGFAVTAFYIAFRKKTSPSADREVYKILCEFCTFLGRCFYLTPYGTCCLRHSILEYFIIIYSDCQSIFAKKCCQATIQTACLHARLNGHLTTKPAFVSRAIARITNAGDNCESAAGTEQLSFLSIGGCHRQVTFPLSLLT